MHDNETGVIVFADAPSTVQVENLTGTYTTQDLMDTKDPDLVKLLREFYGSDKVSTVLKQLDQRNVTVTVTVAAEG